MIADGAWHDRGIARERIEAVLERDLGDPALIYQSQVAPFRRNHYILSIRAVQAIVVILGFVATVAGGFVAADIGDRVLSAYVALLLALWACLIRAFYEQGLVERNARDRLEGWANPPEDGGPQVQ